MKFLVTGASGLVGSQIVSDLIKQDHIVYSCYHDLKPNGGIATRLDLLDVDNIKKTVSEINPDRIIHLAAMTGVDQCETEKDMAMKINCDATKILAEQATNSNVFFVYVSTDYVFDGRKGMRKEDDTPNPLGFYGKSKLAGELELNNLSSLCCIARTSTPFGIHKTKKSFPLWVKENLELKKEIPVLIDQFTSPTYVPNLSKMLIEIATRQITGILHTAGATRISRFNFAKLIAENLNLDKTLLKPTKIANMTWVAPRPMDSSLNISYATKILNEKPQTIQQSIKLFLLQI